MASSSSAARSVRVDRAGGSSDWTAPLVRLFLERSDRDANRVALRYKQFGIWHELTWRDHRRSVERLALGLLELGVGAGDRVAVMGRPTPQWLWADLASQSIGAVTLGLYLTASVDDVRHQVEDSGARVFVAETQEYVDKLYEAEAIAGRQLVDHIVVVDTQGMLGQRSERSHALAEIQDCGARRMEAASMSADSSDGGEWVRLVEQRTGDEPVRMFFTAGTTGRPKGLVLTSRNLLGAWGELFSSLQEPPGPRDRSVSYMPMAHVGETIFSLVLPVLFGSVPHFPEDEDAVNEALVEVSPTLLLAFPRVLELYASSALIDLETGSGLKRWGYRLATRLRRGGRGGIGSWISYQLVFRHLLNTFGFRQVRLAFTGGAPVSPEVARLWHEWGVPLREFYGLAECGGIATVQVGGRPRAGMAGTAAPGVEVRLTDDGEVLVRGPGVFPGYLGQAEQPAVLDGGGWLHTGDLGEQLDDGNFRILDRKQDIFTTASGEVVIPSQLEHALKYGQYVRDAMVVGAGRTTLGALLALDVENLSQWARREKIVYTSAGNLVANPKVTELLERSVDEANARLAEAGSEHRISSFRVLPHELESGDEITPTRTLKRQQLARKFAHLIDEMFADEPVPPARPRPAGDVRA